MMQAEEHPLLSIVKLSVDYATPSGTLHALREFDLEIGRGECVGLVGESGSGKSTVALAIMGLLGGEATIAGGRIRFAGRELSTLSAKERRSIRGDRLSIVFQDPFSSLNPSLPVGVQVAESLVYHRGTPAHAAAERAMAALAEVGLPRAAELFRAYPHQLSGGMQQRVLIATALVCDPELVILDEPTTALDVTVEAGILDLLERLRERRGLSMLFVTHNLGLVNRLCTRVCVLYAGQVLETGPTASVLARPGHPYAKGLLASVPRIEEAGGARPQPIEGRFPDLTALPLGCVFMPRCPFAEDGCDKPQLLVEAAPRRQARCWKAISLLDAAWPGGPRAAAAAWRRQDGTPLLAVEDLDKVFAAPASFRGGLRITWLAGVLPVPRLETPLIHAVDGVTIEIAAGEVLGLVGESGSGKSTLGRCAIRLIEPTRGKIRFSGEDATLLAGEALRRFRGAAQIVFQNPISSLNPRKRVRAALERAIQLFSPLAPDARRERALDLLAKVGLSPAHAERYPHQLSGGERQRVAIARALATGPRLIVCDEPVSALDVSVQATVLNLLAALRDELGLSYLFISHDLAVVAAIADRVAVMYGGLIMEEAPTASLLSPPYHPYTEALLSAAPSAEPGAPRRARQLLAGDPAGAAARRAGCRFSDRCPRKLGAVCETVAPPVAAAGPGHRIRCHIPLEELRRVPPIFELGAAWRVT